MLGTEHIENLFTAMRISYGPQWKHGTDAAGVWLEALRKYGPRDIRDACHLSLREHTNHPPTLPQFLRLVESRRPRHSTYLPAPDTPRAVRVANAALLQVLLGIGGVDRHQLRLCVELKNALAEELDGEPTEAWADDVYAQLSALAAVYDPEARARERAAEVEKFRSKAGITRTFRPKDWAA